MVKNFPVLMLLLTSPAAAQAPNMLSTPTAVQLPTPFEVPPPSTGPFISIAPNAAPPPAPNQQAWSLKSDPLDLKTAADELSRGSLEEQARLYRLAAEMYASAGKDDKAARLLEGYRMQGGRDKTLVTMLAGLYERMGAPAEGAAVMERLAAAYPDDALVSIELARFYRMKGDAKAADDLVLAKARSNPRDLYLQREAAAVMRDAKDYAGAETALRRALELQRDSETYRRLAELYARQGDLDKALAVLEEGGKAIPEEYPGFLDASGQLCRQKGQLEKALKYYKDLSARFSDPQMREPFERQVREISELIAAKGKPKAAN